MTTMTQTGARPIPVTDVPPLGFWQRDPSHFPLPLTVLSRRSNRQTEWFRSAFAEFGIPAVVATGNATELVRDGQILIVDGDAGSVQVEQRESLREDRAAATGRTLQSASLRVNP